MPVCSTDSFLLDLIDKADVTFVTDGDPFLNTVFLSAVEKYGAAVPAMGWQPCHVVARDADGALAGLMPLYRRSHSFGDFSRDYGWAGAWQQAGQAYYPKLVTGIPYTPASGPRFMLRPDVDADRTIAALIGGAIDLARDAGVSVWQCLYVRTQQLAALENAGCLLRPIVQYHWRNQTQTGQRGPWRDFADFLDALTSKRRKEIRRERKRVADQGITIETRHGDEINDALWTAIHRHYLSTFERYGTPAAFTEAFFREVAAGLGRRFVVFIAFRDGNPIASAICYRDRDTLFGRHWGADAEIDCLHFELCLYQGIAYCLREGMQLFEPGAGGEHKISRGFMPTRTWSAYWIDEPRLRTAVADFLERERRAIDDYVAAETAGSPFRAEPAG